MRLLLRYLRQSLAQLTALIAYPAVFALVLALFGLPVSEAMYAALLCLCFGAAALLVGFVRFARRHEQLRRALAHPALAGSLLPEAASAIEEDYQALIHALLAERSASLTALASAQAHRQEYYTLWTHQIKTPLAAMKLILQQQPEDDATRELLTQLFQTEQYVDMALTYLRLDGEQTDFVPGPHSLSGIVRRAARRLAPAFIRRGVRLELVELDATVYTDAKWLEFAVEQLLSNAAKYTPEGGCVSVRWEPQGALAISDTGIGIAPEDLPRVSEYGFTGQNGHERRHSTGIGLYLVQTALKRLGHKFALESRPGEGTTARIYLETTALRAE